jgi:hypothetical protein
MEHEFPNTRPNFGVVRVHLVFPNGKELPDHHIGYVVIDWKKWWEFLERLEKR